MFRYLIIIVLLAASHPVLAQERKEVVNDMVYIYNETDSVEVGVTVQEMKAYGDYYRLHFIIRNRSGKNSIDFSVADIDAMCGSGSMREKLNVVTFDKYMSKVRKRRFLLGDKSSIVDDPVIAIYPIDEDDISDQAVEKRRVVAFSQASLTDIDRAYASGSTALYKLRVERGYMRSNTLKPRHASSSFILIERGSETGVLTVDISVGSSIFRFEWRTDSIPKVKYY